MLAVVLGLLTVAFVTDAGLAQEVPVAGGVVTFDDAIKHALAKIPHLRLAERLTDEAARVGDVAWVRLFPRVDIFTSYSGPSSRTTSRFGALPGAIRIPQLDSRITPDRRFFSGGRRRVSYEIADRS